MAALLAGITLATFSPALRCNFVDFDDHVYIVENRHVLAGLTAQGITWAWTTTHAANWHPLTWMSLMLDAQLFGAQPWGYHLTNLLLHTVNTVLLFALLRRLTREVWPSVLVAALFAVHPLHVESVAWVSERKDVLSTLFGFLALLAYAYYAEAPSLCRYMLVALNLGLSLLAKPMLVTLPCLLLLLDYWPLGRLRFGGDDGRPAIHPRVSPVALLLEKIPLLALSAGSAAITIWAQHQGGALKSLKAMPFEARLSNAVISYLQYLRQTAAPIDLAAFYPYTMELPNLWLLSLAALVLALFTAIVLWLGRRSPHLPVGWLWFVGSLLPVIGLIQVGAQARADRYTYFPLIGIFLLIVWESIYLARRWHCQRAAAILGGFLLICLIIGSWFQVQVWRDAMTLWEHALRVTANNHVAHNGLAIELLSEHKPKAALVHLNEALRIIPGAAEALEGFGLAMLEMGDRTAAIRFFREALSQEPRLASAHNNLGIALAEERKHAAAEEEFREAVRLNPEDGEFQLNLGRTLLRQGKLQESIDCLSKGVYFSPSNASGVEMLGRAYQMNRDWPQAEICFREAVRLRPEQAECHRGLGLSLVHQGRAVESQAAFQESLRLNQRWPLTALSLARMQAAHPDPASRWGPMAVLNAEEVLQVVGDQDARALDVLAAAYAETNCFPEAAETCRKAIRMAESVGQADLAREIGTRLELYRNNKPFRSLPTGNRR